MGVHVVLLPWTSQGHITPVVQLGEVLATRSEGFRVTLVVTARVKARFDRTASPLLYHPLIILQVIDDGLNPDPSYTPSFPEVIASLPTQQQSLESLLLALAASPHPATCLISGSFCSWSKSVAVKVGIPRAELWSSPAFIYCIGFYHHCLLSSGLIPFKGKLEDTWITCIPGLPPIRGTDFVKEFLQRQEDFEEDPERFQRVCQYIKDTYGNANEQYRILVNSVYELDSEALDTLCADGVQALAIGPLFLHNTPNKGTEKPVNPLGISAYEEDRSCLQWLDGKEKASVLYIAFGSEAKIAKDEMQELAHALEASEQRFLWVIRPESVVDETSIDSILPEGFQERVTERGKIVSWAPQMDVLAHPSIVAFLSHCGWNSTLETLWLGVPILAWPQRADQGVNKRFIEEHWKVGIAVEKHEGKATRASIGIAIRELMQEERGAIARERVKEYQELLKKTVQEGGSSRRNLDKFIHDLCSLADQKAESSV
ncbi:hypothetical protein GOP47_0013340 [Adiantum capillus-veneris]|uniref:Glycosyltransferase n=1 Tax=Adiantum capillus-veneris TaxID=13818 RepID=A0A9D4UNC4_ADICA|nr:hypothetical protein GOP47_0013340 [Adiantum capillus-veneris]